MAEVTRKQLLEFIRNNELDLDESYPRSDWWKFRNERDSLRKQRDELVNDMAETKRKAKAFDEIVKIYDDVDNFTDSELMDAIEDKINDLERGSDVEG
ncbi:hypothetical protein K4V26_05670 [Staphylococcus epidermidis]|nr:hypothetical protein [Staphylococcus epidermidis]